MLKFFHYIKKRLESEHTLKMVIELNKKGQNLEALKKCSELAGQYPFDVQIRHRLAMIQREIGQEIHLPNIHSSSTK